MSGVLADQIVDELDRTLCVPARIVLGDDIAEQAARRAREFGPVFAARLTSSSLVRSQTAADVMRVLWPVCDPPDTWWLTPLGLTVAPYTDRVVDQQTAAHVIGAISGRPCARSTVAAAIRRGALPAPLRIDAVATFAANRPTPGRPALQPGSATVE